MSMGPLGGVVGSAAGTSLSQTAGSETERAQKESLAQHRQIDAESNVPSWPPASVKRNKTRKAPNAMPTAAGFGKRRPNAERTPRMSRRATKRRLASRARIRRGNRGRSWI